MPGDDGGREESPAVLVAAEATPQIAAVVQPRGPDLPQHVAVHARGAQIVGQGEVVRRPGQQQSAQQTRADGRQRPLRVVPQVQRGGLDAWWML